MSPDACIGLLHLADRFGLMLHTLAGEPLPALPDVPGRKIVAADAPLSEAELQDITSPTELGLVLGISRQAAAFRLARRAQADDSEGGSID